MAASEAERAALFKARDKARETARLEKTLALVPDDARSALEIGFNDMRFSRRLNGKLDLVCTDLPRPVPEAEGMKIAFADVRSLPFLGRSFDLVMCCEVLEHLAIDTLHTGVKELMRVARRYLMVSVPYRQRVWNEQFRCGRCGYTGNSMQHLHYFDETTMLALFPGAVLLHTEYIGEQSGYAPDLLYRAANTFGNAWHKYNYAKCPGCQNPAEPPKPNFVGELLLRVIWRWEGKVVPHRPAWMLVLLDVAKLHAGGAGVSSGEGATRQLDVRGS